MNWTERVLSSFRDPNGFVYRKDGVLLRQVNGSYSSNYAALKSSGLQAALIESDLLIPVEEVDYAPLEEGAIAVLLPKVVPAISYPYEWSFTQLKDAALLTLKIHAEALERGMVLKDASAYNVQFIDGKPIFIDSLSFEVYEDGEPWIAYGQFCRHFLGPLALIALVDSRLAGLLRNSIDGIPLDLVSALLPVTSKFKPGLMIHIHAHAKAEGQPATIDVKRPRVAKTALQGLTDSLASTVRSLHWSATGTQWGEYYSHNNYSASAMEAKKNMVAQGIDDLASGAVSCWDFGANTGEFSRLASERGLETVAWDIDPGAVETNYLQVKASGEKRLLPLLQDLANPSPSVGWNLRERSSLVERGPCDVGLALALVHHLAIGNNLPLEMICSFFASCCKSLIIEFVPKHDSQVQRLLASREDIFGNYDLDHWRKICQENFEILWERRVPETDRTLFVLRRCG